MYNDLIQINNLFCDLVKDINYSYFVDSSSSSQEELKLFTFQKRKKLLELKKIIEKQFKEQINLIKFLQKRIDNWIDTLELIESINTEKVYGISKKLYGHAYDEINHKGLKLFEVAEEIDRKLKINKKNLKTISSDEMKEELEKKLKKYFVDDFFEIKIIDEMESDAGAGDGIIIIRNGASLNKNDINVFEVHEGWVHLGCGFNAKKQNKLSCLKLISPKEELFQEGLATLMELISMSTYPERLKKIVGRVLAIKNVEDGMNENELIEWFKVRGLDDKTAINSTKRIFKGTLKEGRHPYTRDISYFKGMILLLQLIKYCSTNNKENYLNHLFNGFISFSDLPLMNELEKDGIITKPRYVPKFFQNINKLYKSLEESGIYQIID